MHFLSYNNWQPIHKKMIECLFLNAIYNVELQKNFVM